MQIAFMDMPSISLFLIQLLSCYLNEIIDDLHSRGNKERAWCRITMNREGLKWIDSGLSGFLFCSNEFSLQVIVNEKSVLGPPFS